MLLRSAAIIYMFPLALLLLGGSLGAQFAGDTGSSDGYAAIGAMLGLAAGFVLARLFTLRQRALSSAQPVIARTEETCQFH